MEARGTADSNGADAESKGIAAESKGPAAWKPATRTRKVSQALQAYLLDNCESIGSPKWVS